MSLDRRRRAFRFAPLLAAVVALVAAQPTADAVAQAKSGAAGPPELDAAAWVLLDARSGEQLAAHSVGKRKPIASATKLMTAYLALRDLRFDRVIKAPAYKAAPAELVLGLSEGERISVRDLLVAMMLPSANDAANALAVEVSGSTRKFVKRMNAAAARLDLDDTSYANPIGLDDPDNYSSARDLAALTLELREDERFRRIVGKSEASLKSGDQKGTVQSRNALLLSDDSVDGVKTGRTRDAGFVLVSSAERKGVPLVAVVLGAGSESKRDAASAKLLDYGFSLYDERQAVKRGEPIGTTTLADEEASLELLAGRSQRVRAREDQEIELALDVGAALEGPISEGERLGRAQLSLDGEPFAGVPVLAARAVEAKSLLGGVDAQAALLGAAGLMLLAVVLVTVVRRGRGGSPGAAAERTPQDRLRSRQERISQRQEGKQR
jgi:D-alanyl-D-alanine carboxypeptidase (penicillin-binding protein 5/6)